MELTVILILLLVFPVLWIRAALEVRRLRKLINGAASAFDADFRYYPRLLEAKQAASELAEEAKRG